MAINSIPSDELKPTLKIPVENPVVDPNIYNTSTVLADLAGQQNIAQANVDQLNQQGKTSSSELANLQAQLGGAGQDIQNTYEAQGVNKLYNQIADINAQATGLKNEALAIPIQTQQRFAGTGATDRGVAPITAGALRENALKALSLGQQAAIANAQYDKAKNYADQILTAKYAQIEANIKAKETNIKALKDFELTPAQEKLASAQLARIEREKQEVADRKENEKGIQSIALELAKNGQDPNIVKDSKNVMEAINKAGSMLSTPTTELVKIGDGAMLIDKRTGKVLNKYGSLPGSSSTSSGISPTNKYAGVVNTILASGKFTKDQANAVRTAIQNGEDPVTVIKNNAKNTMNATTAGKLEAAESARDAFNDLSTALSAFYAAGGDTSYIKGNFEKVNNRLGKVKDPELVQLAVQVQGAIQSYRNAISGTAYSEQEGRDIASIFPGINKSEGLNNAIISGRKKLFDSTIDAAYRSTIGSAYDSLKNANVILPKENLSDRDFVEKALTKQGIRYEQIINDVPPGKIPVLDNATGEVGFLPINEFNSNYTKL